MDSLQPGDPQKIGPYVLRGRLGAGGMGEVFFGYSPGGRPVAVKLIHRALAADPAFRRRFRQEAEAARKVGGFHTAQVVDAQSDADRPWLVTAYVAGPTLAQVLSDYGALPAPTVRVLGAGLAEALQAIHAAGLIHRDLKPGNILLADDGPRVIDFGIARAADASGAATQIGTPGFMAPEILTDGPLTPACDVFAVGMVLAFASGARPFGEGRSEAVSYRIVHEPPELSDLDPDLRSVAAACLAKDPADRPSPGQLLRQLASPEPALAWLPEPVTAMAAARKPEYQPTISAGTDPVRAMRLLTEAEQIARAITVHQARVRALVHVAAVLAQADAAHAARVLDDAVHPLSGYLSQSLMAQASDIGRVLARTDAQPARRLLAELEAGMEKPAQAVENENFHRIRLAGLIASVDSDWAERVAHAALDAATRAAALNAASRVVAQSDITRAEQIARTISDSVRLQTLGRQLKKTIPVPRGKRRPASSWNGRDRPSFSPSFFEASALAHIAVTAAGSTDAPAMPRSSVSAQFAPTISGTQAGGRVSARSADAQRLLTEAERVASGLPEAGDDRAHALSEVQLAAVRVRPDGQSRFLAEAENHARAIADGQRRLAALGVVARVAACIDPLRAAQISDPLHPVQRYPVAILIASVDPVQAIRLLARAGNQYLGAVEKKVAKTGTEGASLMRALHDAESSANDPFEFIQGIMLAVFLDSDWAEQALRSIRANVWQTRIARGRLRTDLSRGQLESEQAMALADLADVLLGNKIVHD